MTRHMQARYRVLAPRRWVGGAVTERGSRAVPARCGRDTPRPTALESCQVQRPPGGGGELVGNFRDLVVGRAGDCAVDLGAGRQHTISEGRVLWRSAERSGPAGWRADPADREDAQLTRERLVELMNADQPRQRCEGIPEPPRSGTTAPGPHRARSSGAGFTAPSDPDWIDLTDIDATELRHNAVIPHRAAVATGAHPRPHQDSAQGVRSSR